MFLSHCFAYAHVKVQIRQQQERFVLELKDANQTIVQMTLNYLQAKTLADGLSAMVSQAVLKEFMDTKRGHLLGDMTVTFALPMEESHQQEGGEQICRPAISSVPTGKRSGSRSA